MSSIGGVSSSPNWTSSPRMNPARMQDHLMRKTDTDGSGGIDETELQTLFDKVGVDSSTSASDVLTQADSDGSGDLSAEELGAAARSFMPPLPTTMDFAASRSNTTSTSTRGQAGDDLFGKVDSDSSGGIDASEFQALTERMAQGRSSSTSAAAEERFTALDSDGDGSLSEAEFDAGRPGGANSGRAPAMGGGGTGGMGGVGGMRPPPPPMGGVSQAGESEDSSTDDPLDTNGDGTVSLAERLAGETETTTSTNPLQALFEASDADGDGQLSQDEATQFVEQLSQHMAAARSYEQHADAGNRTQGPGQTLDINI